MHIAICDDNVADRKQMERLLSRESDKRKNDTGVFYINSFGSPDVLAKSPMQYDLFFIDIVQTNNNQEMNEEMNGLTFALELFRAGVTAPVILCISTIDYRKQRISPSLNISFLEKPIRTAELSKILDRSITQRDHMPSMIELRTETETFYVKDQDIICGCVNGHIVDITLTDGRSLPITGTLINLYNQLAPYPSFHMISKKAFINMNYIARYSFTKVKLTNDMAFHVSPGFHADFKKGILIKQQL